MKDGVLISVMGDGGWAEKGEYLETIHVNDGNTYRLYFPLGRKGVAKLWRTTCSSSRSRDSGRDTTLGGKDTQVISTKVLIC
jgi:hypothetical protein